MSAGNRAATAGSERKFGFLHEYATSALTVCTTIGVVRSPKTTLGVTTLGCAYTEITEDECTLGYNVCILISLTEASVRDLQVPQVDPEVVCGDKMLPVTVRVYRVNMIRVGICEHPPEACRHRRPGHQYLRQYQRPFAVWLNSFSRRITASTNFLNFFLANLPQLHGFI